MDDEINSPHNQKSNKVDQHPHSHEYINTIFMFPIDNIKGGHVISGVVRTISFAAPTLT